MAARSTVSRSSCDSRVMNGRAMATKSLRTEDARRRMAGPSRTRPLGEAAMTSFSLASEATMRCTVERARLTRWAIWPRLSPSDSPSSARRMHAARAITCTWVFSFDATTDSTTGVSSPCIPVQPSPISGTGNSGKSGAMPRRVLPKREDGLVKKIALEEHFLCPGFIEYWDPTVAEMPAAKRQRLLDLNTDFGEVRLASMDKAGIERAVLGLAGPGVQAEKDTATAIRNARAGNDFLAKEIQKRPDRYSGFAHLAMQDAKAAADELERCVTDLKFCGAMINGHTNGQYLDHPSLTPFWERAEALGAAIYIHPTDPITPTDRK